MKNWWVFILKIDYQYKDSEGNAMLVNVEKSKVKVVVPDDLHEDKSIKKKREFVLKEGMVTFINLLLLFSTVAIVTFLITVAICSNL